MGEISQQLLPSSTTRKETQPFYPLYASQSEAGSPHTIWQVPGTVAFWVGPLRRQ